MRIVLNCILAFVLLFSNQISFSQTIDEYVKKAEGFNQAGDLEQAATVMEEAIQKYPDNSTAFSYLGLYRGMQAGRTQNFMEAGRFVEISYDKLNKAVALDPNNAIARFHRGLMSVSVPPFMGKLDEGIQDLELLIKIHEKTPDKFTSGTIASAYNFLAQGYQKKEDGQKAIAAWKKVIELAPNSDLSKNAEKSIATLMQPKAQEPIPQEKYSASDAQALKQKADKSPDDPALLVKLGKAFYDTRDFEKADPVLRKAIRLDSANVEAYKLLIRTTEQLATKGYDERIYTDTDTRSKLAFEITNLAEKAVAIAPNDPELRVMRGSIGVMMPFFVGKLDKAMEDLTWVAKSDAPKDIKAEALYWLGYAYQKKATTQWIKVITDYKNTEASHLAFESMKPAIQQFDPQKHQRPFLEIDFVLGFRDELAPQSAVWIEDKNGNFVKTVYVSGFSGHAKEKQANLTDWAKASKFRDTDAVTAASIDVGHHIYVWDLKDHQGKQVKAGEYVVKVEVAFWPSMEYQSTKANFTIGKKDSKVVVEEGNLIPYVMVKYYSE
ncbi:MAG TPA: DUF2271 domain-containing protein [bacterium]